MGFGFGFSFSFGAVTTTSGSWVCAVAAPPKPSSAMIAEPPQEIAATHSRKTSRTSKSALNAAKGVAKRPAHGGRAVRRSKMMRLPRSSHRHSRAQARGRRQISNDRNQARGGARDWKKACCGGTKTAATRSKCSIGREAKSAGTCGACGTNEFAARWIVAQIAQ